jgi:hypothetical protein
LVVSPTFGGRKKEPGFDFFVGAYYYLGRERDSSNNSWGFDIRGLYPEAFEGTAFLGSPDTKPLGDLLLEAWQQPS